MGHKDHKHHAREESQPLDCAVIIVSDTRTPDTDVSGKRIMALFNDAGHKIEHYEIIPDEPEIITALVDSLTGDCGLIILSGGTGIAKRDTTYEAITAMLEKEISGFGELFRHLSYEEIGSSAMLSRATGGLYKNTLLFSIPGSTGAVELAMTKLILPELDHMAWLTRD